MELQQALAAIAAQQNGTRITATDIQALLQNVNGTTFAGITQVTPVPLAAKNKHLSILKVTASSVQLFNNANSDIYGNQVRRKAEGAHGNDAAAVEQFETQENYYEHDSACYSLVKHRSKGTEYLYCIVNNAKSVYVMDGQLVDKQTVAQYMTPSGARDLLNPKATVVNQTHGIEHDVIVRTVKLENIVRIAAAKQELTV